VESANQRQNRGARTPHDPQIAHPSAYSAYFSPQASSPFSDSTIRLPGDDPRLPRDRVVRPALAVLFRIAVGPSADRYVRRFLAFERTGHTRPGWHWPSFLLPGVWAFYRKLWVIGLLFALLPIAGAFGFAAIEPTFERADFIWIACAIVAVWVLPGVLPALLADSLLYNHCRYLVSCAERSTKGATDAVQRLSERSPTSAAAALVLGGGALVGIVGVIVPPLHSAYVDQGVRAQVAQVLDAVRGLEDDIEANWYYARLLPRQTDNAAVRAHAGAALIEDVDVHPNTGRLKVALGPAVPELAGKTILIAPTRDMQDRWNWMCVPVDIPRRYLPKECRG